MIGTRTILGGLVIAASACATPDRDTPRSLRAEIARDRAAATSVRTRAAEEARAWRDEVDDRGHGAHLVVDEKTERVDADGLESFVDATPYRGQIVQLSGRVRVAGEASNARLWLRVVSASGRTLLHDDMANASVRASDWTPVEMVAAIAPTATRIEFGVLLDGNGPFGVDDVSLVAVRELATTDPPLLARLTRRQIDDASVQSVRLRSELLSRFWGRDIFLEAGVVAPLDARDGEVLPITYHVPDFGGSWADAYTEGVLLAERMRSGHPRSVLVYLEPMCAQGHHGFVDSVNTGPWGEALVSELIPALEARSFGGRAPRSRFLTGHGHGGWSSLWLQITYPHLFDGAWATAPTPVDFRDFLGVDVYESRDLYYDAAGAEVPLVRDGDVFVESLRAFARADESRDPIGGWMASFEALASPRGDDGRPMALFDRKTGRIDPSVAQAWRKRDIGAILRERWSALGPKLSGKLHVWVGDQDTYRCEGAVKRLASDLEALGARIDVVVAQGRGRFDLEDPDPVLWPYGMTTRIHREMASRANGVPAP